MPELPTWLVDAILVVVVCWFIDREIVGLKAWIESLVGGAKRNAQAERVGRNQNDNDCVICGRPWSEDYADCPTCLRHWKEDAMCGKQWTEVAIRRQGERRR